MTKDWFAKVYEQVGADFMQAKIDTLLHEFRYLGETNGHSTQLNNIDGIDGIDGMDNTLL